MEDYTGYLHNDFIEDKYFLEWVKRPSQESQKFWEEFIFRYPQKQEEIEMARLIIKSMVPAEDDLIETEIDLLRNRIERPGIRKRGIKKHIWYRVAAACLIILFVSIWWIKNQKHNKNYEMIDYSQILSLKTVDKYVELRLADQTKVEITEKESELKYNANGELVINSGKSIQQKSDEKDSGQESFNTLMVPWGKRVNITFTDGTRLWLNSGSKVVYPVVFNKGKREIYIEGEGYLEVAHDESRPFIVKTNKMDVQVLGTSFNITAYPEDVTTNVVLIKGKIVTRSNNDSEMVLLPNQMISFDNQTQKTDLKEVNVNDYISWKDGWLLCKSEDLHIIIEKLERYYNQEVTITDEKVKFYHLSGKLDLQNDISQVLQIIVNTVPVKIEVVDGSINISSK